MVLGKLPVPGCSTILMIVGQGPIEECLTLQEILQIFSHYSRENDFIREYTISKLEQTLLK